MSFRTCENCKWERGKCVERCHLHSPITDKEHQLILRFGTRQINETQFDFLINEKGLDREKMYYLLSEVDRMKSQVLAGFSVGLVLFAVLALSLLLKSLFGS